MTLPWTLEMSQHAPASDTGDEARLIAASRGGDSDAFGELVRLHQHRVFRLCGRFFRLREDLEEVAQETFLTAWTRLDTYRARAPFEHWLTRVCLNCCYARLRRSKNDKRTVESAAEPAVPPTDPDAALEVERLFEALSPDDRFVLLMLDGEGWTVSEIAERLGWTRVNVKVRAHRARKKLRQILERGTPS